MTRIALTSALALALAGPALASDQIAGSLGVAPGAYSTAELIQLRSALEDGHQAQANAILAGTVTDGATPSPAQFAASVGLDGSSSVATIAALRSARENNEQATARALLDTGSVRDGFSASTKSGVSAGRAQLAASLNVDPAEYSLAELVRLKSIQSSDNGRNE
ncbi:hypothetical protein [Tropicimonas sp. IMCC6043]|uniref:hypothetical protein n=1 Tax=Tropicimonas sp. IMCC6043 TaxID=2510645 RepID=UPI00101DCB9B|nr:hypothetical protein [Tropicimonas sp. IMCC6043]RYH07728.1 hypothetical protein EU800_19115 [Tropicimonas sp. IMCC6043]